MNENVTNPHLSSMLVILFKRLILSHWTGEIFQDSTP